MDESILFAVNQGWAHPWLDVFFSWVTQKKTFSHPLLFLILVLLIKGWGRSGFRLWLLLLLFIGFGDMFGNFLKHLIAQPRPCADLPETIRLVTAPFHVGCSFKPHGMPSNHALNFFLTASFLGVVLRSWKWGISFGLIAITVAVSRVYLGVHYPSQVFTGAMIGGLLGASLAFLAVQQFSPISGWLRLSARKDKHGFYARSIYSLILYLSVPFVLVRLLWRGRNNHDYWRRWLERFGWFKTPSLTHPVWVHAVSVGEVQAALPLIRELIFRHPNNSIVVTTMTPTGSGRVQSELGDKVYHVYMPYDLPGAVERFLDRIKPKCLLVMETELWPNVFYQSRQRNLPVIVANARLSERSLKGYQRIKHLTQATLQQISFIAAQGPKDAEHFKRLGFPSSKIQVTGSIKFDLDIPESVIQEGKALRQTFGDNQSGQQRPAWIAASTHEGEEEKVLQAHSLVQEKIPEALLVLVPRHKERFSSVANLCERKGFTVVRRSENKKCVASTQIFLGDTLGELLKFFVAADIAFVGGSLVPTGGHNVMEPAALGVPVITGPHMFNFAEITQSMKDAGALLQVENSEQLAEFVFNLLQNRETCNTMALQGKKIVADNRGSLDRLLEHIKSYI